ncbi:MAG: GH3 auxin-responsive promoter family protein [Saprospirales bacterium]|nr:GH3 auxin-responsive promoter family protein [Saprospirales bacterium]
MKRVRRYMEHPLEVQQQVLRHLLHRARDTEFGRKYEFNAVKNWEEFSRNVPVRDYEQIKPFIERMMYGEPNVLWPGQVRFFSKSSGTTEDRSKFIPVSLENLYDSHIRGARDTMTFFYQQRKDARIFWGKSLIMGGSLTPFPEHPDTIRGDVSAILNSHVPWYTRPFLTPDPEIVLMANFEEKIEAMAQALSKEPLLVGIGGVPTWTVVLLRRILEITGKKNLLEVWPHIQAYIHGGVSFLPYKEQFCDFFPTNTFSYQEVYNASEGYFASQNDLGSDDMLLLLDNNIYYEFLPMEEWESPNPKAIPLEAVEKGKVYAMIISNNGGLWRYNIGDTVTFTSTHPYKIKIKGRTKQFINAFGEELMVDNAERALAMTCEALNAVVSEYTAAPIYFEGAGRGGHQWIVEFKEAPKDVEQFATLLDKNLQGLNSDYEAKRYKNIALERLCLHAVPPGTFVQWMKHRGKFGGQHKVPRLANHREYVSEILRFLEN